MSLQLIKSPAKFSPTGNNVSFVVSTDNAYASEGDYSAYTMRWIQGDIVGNTISISWLNHIVTFEAKNHAFEADGIHYPIWVSGTLLAYTESLVSWFSANYLLSKYFHLYFDSALGKIVLRALNKGIQYIPAFDFNAAYVTIGLFTEGLDEVLNDGYEIFLRIFRFQEPENTPFLFGEMRLKPGTDNTATFNVQDYIHRHLSPVMTWPEDNTVHVIEYDDYMERFFIQYCEYFDGVYSGLQSSGSLFYGFPGKISQLHFKHLADLGMTFNDQLVANEMFLSWHPDTKLVSKSQPEKLYFLNFTGLSRIKFKCAVYYDDNTFEVKTLLTLDPPAWEDNNYKVYEICCGFEQLKLQYKLRTVSFYTIWVESMFVPISSVRKFEIDPMTHINERFFFFLNSLGVYETFRSTGLFSNTNEFTFMSASIVQDNGISQIQVNSNYSGYYEETFTGNSGWVSKEELAWINDFILSSDIKLIEQAQLFPILITSNKIFQKKDKSNMFFIEFEYKKSIKSTAFTPDHSLDYLMDETGEPILTENDNYLFV